MKKHGNIQIEANGVRSLRCMNNAYFEKKLVNDNIVLDVFIICQKLRHVQVIKKNIVFVFVGIHRPSK